MSEKPFDGTIIIDDSSMDVKYGEIKRLKPYVPLPVPPKPAPTPTPHD